MILINQFLSSLKLYFLKTTFFKIIIRIPAFIKLLYFLSRLYFRKIRRLVLRFIRRFLQIWYIGFSLILINILFVKLGVIINTWNIAITVYIIDFLKIEYDRRKNANSIYYTHLYMDIISNKLLYMFSRMLFNDLLKGEKELLSLSNLDIVRIISKQQFWNTQIKINIYTNTMCKAYFNKTIRKCIKSINELYYISLPKDRNTFKALKGLKTNLEKYLDDDLNYQNSNALAVDFYHTIKQFKEVQCFHKKWWRDYDLENKIQNINYNYFRRQSEFFMKLKGKILSINGEI